MNTLQLKRAAGGFFSTCTVACYDIIEHIKKYQSVPEVDLSKSFKWYKDFSHQNVYDMCFKFNKSQELNINKISKMDYTKNQLFHYNNEDFVNLKPIIQKWFKPSDPVLDYVEFFIKKYEIDTNKTLAICFRGTDKYKEVGETSYEIFLSHVPKIIKNKGINRVFIQTDQAQFIDFFKNSFPDTPFFIIEEIPTTTSNIQLYRQGGVITENRVVSAQMFLASTQILSSCKFLINHTGNVARWITKYRGSAYNTIQYQNNQLLQ